jgi:2-desacetyl-2-hydroxyethyl bacteriochlorophyllide A dehydrogenase
MERFKRIVFTKTNTAEYLDCGEVDFNAIGENQVVVKSFFTTVSAGTERANITASENTARGEGGKLFPRYLGYNCAGEVVKVGAKVSSVAVGDKVVVYWSTHSNYNIVNEEQVVKFDDTKISFEDAAVSFIATFPIAAIRKVKLEIGESLMVMGLGILGQLAVKLARAAGATPIVACDPVKERREEALKNGADYEFDPFEVDFAKKVRAVTDGGLKTAIEVTGVGAGLDETLDCMAEFGRVALLGCTRSSDFSIDYYNKVHFPGITLVGAHTHARAKMESSHGNYTHNDDIKAVLKLCGSGRLTLKDIVKETHNPKDCGEVYTRLVNDKNFPVGVQFDWRKE